MNICCLSHLLSFIINLMLIEIIDKDVFNVLIHCKSQN